MAVGRLGLLKIYAAAFAVASFHPTAASKVKNPDQLEYIKELPWTCLAPVEENANLSETDLGKSLISWAHDHFNNFEEQIQQSVKELCKSHALKPSWCNEMARGLALYMAETYYGRPECANFSMQELRSRCSDVPPGSFCLRATDMNRNPHTCMLMGPQPEDDSQWKAVPMECPRGFTCEGELAEPVTCPKGVYCPGNETRARACQEGFFCPVAVVEKECDESVSSQFGGMQCIPDTDGRVITPVPCEEGHFCQRGHPKACPAKHYCPTGAEAKIACGPFEICPGRSARPNRMPLLAVETIALVTAVCGVVSRLKEWLLAVHLYTTRWALVVVLLISLWLDALWTQRAIMPHLHLTCCGVLVIYGTFISAKVRDMLGHVAATTLEPLFWTTVVVAFGLVTGDLNSGLFCGLLVPFVLVAHWVSVGRMRRDGQIAILIASVGSILGLLAYFDHTALPYYAFGIPCFLISDYMYQRMVAEDLNPLRSDSDFNLSQMEEDEEEPPSPPLKVPFSMRNADANDSSPMADMRSSLVECERSVDGDAHLPQVHNDSSETSMSSAQGTRQGICFELLSISLVLPNKHVVLDTVSLAIPAGTSVAVMGPSGCGKTSITNVLSGRAGYGSVLGGLRVNGRSDISVKSLAPVTGFVPQDDIMHRNLTVEENVTFSAHLRLPQTEEGSSGPSMRSEQVREAVSSVLQQLGLGGAKVRSTVIGNEASRGVSGGQRKRVSFAMEFVSSPSLLFLDEPTSGLDSTTSHSVVDVFTKAARRTRCTTVAVIHQPRYETLLLFDRVIMLASGGHLVYSGPVIMMEDYFRRSLHATFPEKANPADVVMDLISLESAKRWMDKGMLLKPENADALHDAREFGRWLSSIWIQEGAFEPDSFKGVTLPKLTWKTCSWGEEVVIHFKRAMLQIRRDRLKLLINNLMLSFGLTVFCTCAPPTSRESELFHPCLAIFLLMLSQGAAAQRTFGGQERYIIWREAGARINTALCFIGRDIAAFVEMGIASAVFSMLYWSLGPVQASQYLMFWCSFTTVYATYGLNYIFSVMLPPESAQMVSVVSTFLCFFGAGVNPNFSGMAKERAGVLFMALSPIRWSYGYLMHEHVLVQKSSFSNKMIQHMASRRLNALGMPLSWIDAHGWDCESSVFSCSERMAGDGDRPPNSFVCSLRQLLFLGTYFRAVALLCMLITSRLKAQGGGRLFDDPFAGPQSKVKKRSMSMLPRILVGLQLSGRMMRNVLACFLVLLTHLQLSILLKTK